MSLPVSVPLDGVQHLGHTWFGAELTVGVVALLVLLLMVRALLVVLGGTGLVLLARLTGAARAPESVAHRILAERLARGDISTDDFLERASILNWTPGAGPQRGNSLSSR